MVVPVKTFICISACLMFSCSGRKSFTQSTDVVTVMVEEVTDGIAVPFAIDFLPDGTMLVTDRPSGRIFSVDIRSGKKTVIQNTPAVLGEGDGGMLDLRVHPDYDQNGWLYFSFATAKDSLSTMVVERARLDGNRLTDRERLFTALPYYKEPNHFGSRLLLTGGYLFITMGERYYLRDSAQHLSNHLGKVIRLHDDGRIPEDNPFVADPGALHEIWSIGHRNPQGLAQHPATGEIWEHEHGPKGGDEINIIKPSLNYGWPLICHGIDYDGSPIGAGITYLDGMEQPSYHFTPSIAPSGMEFYNSTVIPAWKGSLFIGAMALKHLNRLVIKDGRVVTEERVFSDKNWRVRSVKAGPDGFLYLGIDGGKVLRIRPAE